MGDGQLGVVVVPAVEVWLVGGALEGSVVVCGVVVVELGVVEVVVVVVPDELVDWVLELQLLPEELDVVEELLVLPELGSVAWPLPPLEVAPPLSTVGSVWVCGWVEVGFVCVAVVSVLGCCAVVAAVVVMAAGLAAATVFAGFAFGLAVTSARSASATGVWGARAEATLAPPLGGAAAGTTGGR